MRGRVVRVVSVRAGSGLHSRNSGDSGGDWGGCCHRDGLPLGFSYSDGAWSSAVLLGESKARERQNGCE